MRKKDLFKLTQPLLPRCFSLAMCLLPDDLQAQQLVIDAFTQVLLKEKQDWLAREFDEKDKRALQQQRKLLMRSIVRAIVELAFRRSQHLGLGSLPANSERFYRLDLKTRAVACLRFQQGWVLEEIEKALGFKRHEVIEKLHNSRFLLVSRATSTVYEHESRL